MKKILCKIIISLAIMTAYPQIVLASDNIENQEIKAANESGGFEYTVLSDGTAEITGYTGPEASCEDKDQWL